ncbi:hypothetical protein H0H92_008279 [Tricholoma furcatifolium]|nr:hypothetical protein H0H92_008279 [Tricholoma furcatifolium]
MCHLVPPPALPPVIPTPLPPPSIPHHPQLTPSAPASSSSPSSSPPPPPLLPGQTSSIAGWWVGACGATNFFKAVEGVCDQWLQRSEASSTGVLSFTALEEVIEANLNHTEPTPTLTPKSPPTMSASPSGLLRPFSLLQRGSVTPPLTPAQSPVPPASTLPESLASSSKNLAAWGAGIGSFISTRTPTFLARKQWSDTPGGMDMDMGEGQTGARTGTAGAKGGGGNV